MGEFVKKISDEDFDLIKNAELPVLVDFGATWCGPCKMIEPILEEVAKEEQNSILILKVNIDDCPKLTQQFAIKSVPTLILFNKGEVVSTKIGALSKHALLENPMPLLLKLR